MKKNKQILKTIVSKVKNPYLILIFLFVMWMLFFDSNSYLNHLSLSNSINQLEKDIETMKATVAKAELLAAEAEKLDSKLKTINRFFI